MGESTVSVSETGIIEGGVVATHVVVNGVVRGDVHATGKVALGPNARIIGNVQYGIIESAIGAQIAGTLVQARPPSK
jgi:cytoskeletal protein CcmA (bactofilin family)